MATVVGNYGSASARVKCDENGDKKVLFTLSVYRMTSAPRV